VFFAVRLLSLIALPDENISIYSLFSEKSTSNPTEVATQVVVALVKMDGDCDGDEELPVGVISLEAPSLSPAGDLSLVSELRLVTAGRLLLLWR